MRARHFLPFVLASLVAACDSSETSIEVEDAAVDTQLDDALDATVDGADATLETDATAEDGSDSGPSPEVGGDGAVLPADADADGTSEDGAIADTAVGDASDDTSDVYDAYDATDTRDTAPPDTVWTTTLCAPFADDAATDAAETAVEDAHDAQDAVGIDATTCTATRVRIVAANTTTGNNSTYQEPGIRIFQALKPDIALIQELKYATGVRALVDVAFGPEFQTALEIVPGSIPNGIVSRYPILASGEWDDPDLVERDFVWARIDVPGPIDLWAVSVHLRTAGSLERDAEAKNLMLQIEANVPAGDYLVIGGDLNTAIENEIALLTLSGRVSIAPPYAVDQAGNNKTSAPRSKPYDWVLPSPNLLARMMPVRIGTSWFEHGFVFDTRVFTPIEEVAPALATDSATPGMQHMAVVRDFALGE